MNLDQDFFQISKFSEDQKKRFSPEMEHFFSPNSSRDLRADAQQSQIIGRDADEDHTQIVGGYTVKLLGECIPPSPRVSTPLASPNCLFPCGSFKTVAFVFLGPIENSQKSRPIWRVELFFFEISRELEVKQTTPIWRDNLSFSFFLRSTENLELVRAWSFIFGIVSGDQHQFAQFCGSTCKNICPS